MNMFIELRRKLYKQILTVLPFCVFNLFLTELAFSQEEVEKSFEEHVKISAIAATTKVEILCGEEIWLSNTCDVLAPKSAEIVLLDEKSSKYVTMHVEKFEGSDYGQEYIYSIRTSPFAPKGTYHIMANLVVTTTLKEDTTKSIGIEHYVKVVDWDVENVEDLNFHIECINYYNKKWEESSKKAKEAIDKSFDALRERSLGAARRYQKESNEFQEMMRIYRAKRRVCHNHLLKATKSTIPEVRKKAIEFVEFFKTQEKS